MRPSAFDPHRLLPWPPALGQGLQTGLRWGASHTGLPVVVFAAIAIVVSWHFFRRTLRLAVDVVIAIAALLVATRLGWIVW
jgi:hypothetical protein